MMQLEILRDDEHASSSDQEKAFVERIRTAVSGINYRFRDECHGIGTWEQYVVAVVYHRPLRLDFKACTPGENATAFFFNPMVEVSEAIFAGNELIPEIRNQLESDLTGYRQRIREADDD